MVTWAGQRKYISFSSLLSEFPLLEQHFHQTLVFRNTFCVVIINVKQSYLNENCTGYTKCVNFPSWSCDAGGNNLQIMNLPLLFHDCFLIKAWTKVVCALCMYVCGVSTNRSKQKNNVYHYIPSSLKESAKVGFIA